MEARCDGDKPIKVNHYEEQMANKGRLAFLLDGLLPTLAETLNEKIDALPSHVQTVHKNGQVDQDNPEQLLEIMTTKEKIEHLAEMIQTACQRLLDISAEMVCVNKRPTKVIQCDADGDSIFELEENLKSKEKN